MDKARVKIINRVNKDVMYDLSLSEFFNLFYNGLDNDNIKNYETIIYVRDTDEKR